MKKYAVTITGITPYMSHRMDDTSLDNWEKNRGRIIERPELTHEDNVRAQFHMHLNYTGKPSIPTEQIRQALIGASTLHKSKMGNGKRSMKNIVAGQFLIQEEFTPLNEDDWVVDKRSAVNHNNKARVIVIRPKWINWESKFTLLVDNDTETEDTIKNIIVDAGKYIGIGSYRPTNKGYFGRFDLTSFKKVD